MSKASPAKYTNIDVANATLDAAEDRIAELQRDLERARAALERIACIPCNDPRCTEERPCATHIAREALPSWRLDADREEERAKCSRCNGSGRVMVPCSDDYEGCMVAHFGPCPNCTPAPSAAEEERQGRRRRWLSA